MMKTVVKDVTSESFVKTERAISTLDRAYVGGALILIGHGSESGETFEGMSSVAILKCNVKTKVIWFYACNCGRVLIKGFQGSGIVAIGHCCHILRFPEYDPALDALLSLLERWDSQLSCHVLMVAARESLYEAARRCVEREDLLFASIISQIRLSARCCS